MNEWPEGVDETEDDAFTWNASSTKDGGSGGERIDSDKLLRDVETMEHGMPRNTTNLEENGDVSSGETTGLLRSMMCPYCSIQAGRKYYAQANDVTIGNHLLQALAPFIFLKDESSRFLMGSSETVELYGPIWIVLTFILVLTAAGAVWRYFHSVATDVHLIWIAAVLLLAYVIATSVMIWYFGGKLFPSSTSFSHALCISGYALTAYVPMSALSAIPVPYLSWCLLSISTVSSAIFLLHPRGGLSSTKTDELQDGGLDLFRHASVAYPVFAWQAAFALGVKFLFFH